MNKKTTLIILALALANLGSATLSHASDWGCYRRTTVKVAYCAPYVLKTKEVCRRTECRWAKDHCGRRYSYMVTVITYASYYSDGTCRQFTRSYRG